MRVQIELEVTQVKKLVDQLPKKEKETLARHLDDQTLFEEMRRVQRELKDAPITMGEIAVEAKAARKNRAVRARK
jgi:uncharacterized protein with von Willebrand factor type A (vWA) domain